MAGLAFVAQVLGNSDGSAWFVDLRLRVERGSLVVNHLLNISAAQSGISGVYRNIQKIPQFSILVFFSIFVVFYGVPQAREVSRNLPGARGSIFPK